jgi:hypothetical protein
MSSRYRGRSLFCIKRTDWLFHGNNLYPEAAELQYQKRSREAGLSFLAWFFLLKKPGQRNDL